MNLLHIFGQTGPHEDVWVVGNRDGLMALRDAINRVIDGVGANATSSCVVTTNDGEAYAALVWEMPNPATENELRLPYGKNGSHPFELVGSDEYRDLMTVLGY